MAERPVNLRLARKAQARKRARAEADANAARHGEAWPEKAMREAEAARIARRLDGHRLADDDAAD